MEEGDCIADAYCNLGILEWRQGNPEVAFDCFSRALTADPCHVEAHYNIANYYFEIEDLRLAREHYELAARLENPFANIFFNLGLVLAIQNDYKAAIHALRLNISRWSRLKDAGVPAELLATLQRSLAAEN